MIRTIILLIIVYVLNLVDYLQTVYAVQHLGIAIEFNPIFRFCLEHNCAWVAKLIIPAILLALLGFIIKTDKYLMWLIYAMIAFYFVLIIRNFEALTQFGLL